MKKVVFFFVAVIFLFSSGIIFAASNDVSGFICHERCLGVCAPRFIKNSSKKEKEKAKKMAREICAKCKERCRNKKKTKTGDSDGR